jgi:hypothetical protein
MRSDPDILKIEGGVWHIPLCFQRSVKNNLLDGIYESKRSLLSHPPLSNGWMRVATIQNHHNKKELKTVRN